jgi:hypothetical protein
MAAPVVTAALPVVAGAVVAALPVVAGVVAVAPAGAEATKPHPHQDFVRCCISGEIPVIVIHYDQEMYEEN